MYGLRIHYVLVKKKWVLVSLTNEPRLNSVVARCQKKVTRQVDFSVPIYTCYRSSVVTAHNVISGMIKKELKCLQ